MSSTLSDVYATDFLSNEQIEENFLNTFQLLSEKQKKIWQYLQSISNRYRQVFPSHDTIAKEVGCHRHTVINAIKIFAYNQWIFCVKRCYRSNLYSMASFLRKFDTRKNETFRLRSTEKSTEKSTENSTLYNNVYSYTNNVRYTSEQQTGAVHDIDHEKRERHIANEKEYFLERLGINDKKDKFCLSRFNVRSLRNAYEDYTTRWYKSGPVRNVAAWITSRCKEYENRYKNNRL